MPYRLFAQCSTDNLHQQVIQVSMQTPTLRLLVSMELEVTQGASRKGTMQAAGGSTANLSQRGSYGCLCQDVPVPRQFCANTSLRQHMPLPAHACANSRLFQHVPVPIRACANTRLCQYTSAWAYDNTERGAGMEPVLAWGQH